MDFSKFEAFKKLTCGFLTCGLAEGKNFVPRAGRPVASSAVASLAGGACATRFGSRFFCALARKRGRRPDNALKSNVMELCLTRGSYDLVSFAGACARTGRGCACLPQYVASAAEPLEPWKISASRRDVLVRPFRNTCLSEVGPLRQQ